MELTAKPGYRADIDGLRAIAVLSVLAFHFGAPIRGGFTGVDVFFVISGFLITQVLAAEISSGTFSISQFLRPADATHSAGAADHAGRRAVGRPPDAFSR